MEICYRGRQSAAAGILSIILAVSRRCCPSLLLISALYCSSAWAQNACLVYNYADQNTGCRASASSAAAAVAGVIACDGPLFCQSSTSVLNSVDIDPQEAGTSFRVTITYFANPAGVCGQTNTQSSWGSITNGTGANCNLQYYVVATPPPNNETRSPNGVGEPVDPAVGNVYRTEDDVIVSGPGGLAFQRFYSSLGTGTPDLSPGWSHSYSRAIVAVGNYRYVPYPTFVPQSSLYNDPATACTSGFPEIQSHITTWQAASASWNGSSCVIQRSGALLGTLQIQSTAQPLGSVPTVTEYDAVRDDGQVIRFSFVGGVLKAPAGMRYQLVQTGAGFMMTDPEDTIETYDSAGKLLSIARRDGTTLTLSYDSGSHLSTVTDSFGTMLTLTYTAQSKLSTVALSAGPPPASCLVYNYADTNTGCSAHAASAVDAVNGVIACDARLFCGTSFSSLNSVVSDPAVAGQSFVVSITYHASAGCGSSGTGNSSGTITAGSGSQCGLPSTVQFAYDSQGRLRNVEHADGSIKTYAYENSLFTNYLTGVVDENANRFSTWGYDNQGRAVSAQEMGASTATTLAYNSPTSVTVTDALGAVRTFTYTRVGDRNLPVSISGSRCPTCEESAQTTYDDAGFVSSRADYNGNLTCYKNDPARGLELVRVEGLSPGSLCPADLANYLPPTNTPQRKIATTWHSAFALPLTIIEANRTSSFTYDSAGNLLTRTVTDTTVSPSAARTWTFTYDGYGRVLTADGPRTDVLDVTTFTYYPCSSGSQCGQLQTVTDAAGHVTTFDSYNMYGHPLSITDANGVVTTLSYDKRQHLISRATAGETTNFSYYPTGQLRTVTLPDGSSVQYSYDSSHRLTQLADGLGNRIVYTLDALGNRTSEKVYDPSNALHYTHTRVINTLSQVYQEINAAGTAAVTTTFGYDSNGNQTSVQAPLSRKTASAYDELNRLTQITDPASGTTAFSYDTDDNIGSVTDPRGLVTSYAYNGFADLSTQLSPDTGLTANTYDSGGNLATSTDARGAVSTYSYDALNRVTSIVSSVGGVTDSNLSFSYDAGTYGTGHLTGTGDSNYSEGWTYDALGREIGHTQVVGGVSRAVGYNYTNGNLTGLSTPSGQMVTYGYNSNHQVTSITLNGMTVLSSVTREPFGPVRGWTWGNSTATSRTYDTDQKISQISSHGVRTYVYDDAFRIAGISDTSSGASNWNYGYDSLDRITSGSNGTVTRGWTYDANGNRLTETGSSPSTYSVAAGSNRISATTGALARTFGYDAAGNTTSYSTVSASYNARGRLQTITNGANSTSFIYNAVGQMIQSNGTLGSVQYVYDALGHLIGEYDGSGQLVEETVWLDDIPVATLRPNGTSIAIYYVHTDHLNTPRQVTRPSDNAQMWTWFSDPFGTDAANGNPGGAGSFAYNLRFPGQVFDGTAGLHYNYYRDGYDPAVGRYTQSDPVGLAAGVNTFAYVKSNPISAADPFGLSSLIYDRGAGTITVVNSAGVAAGTFPAANNAQKSSNGPWPVGGYDYSGHTTHPDDGPNSAYGSYGNFQFHVPGRTYMGVHSGRRDKADRAGRRGYQHATDGCIRTTDDATKLINDLVQGGDPLTSIVVTDSYVPTNLPSLDPDVTGAPHAYEPDVRP